MTILRTCRRAMGRTGTLLVVDRVLGPPAEGADPGLSDRNMLVLPGGRERTRVEWAALLESAELRLLGVTATASEVSVIEGIPT